jgi:hypothetical protein
VPDFKKVEVHCFESSTMEVHQVCACWALKEVCNQLSGRLKDTSFNVLAMTVYDPNRQDTYDAKYLKVTTEEENKKLQMANWCMLVQDQALYWADCEIVFLRWSGMEPWSTNNNWRKRSKTWSADLRRPTRGTVSWWSWG